MKDLGQDGGKKKSGVKRSADDTEPVGQESTRRRAAPPTGATEPQVERIRRGKGPHGIYPPSGLGQLQGPVLMTAEEIAWARDAIDRPKSFEGHMRKVKINVAEIAEQVPSTAEQCHHTTLLHRRPHHCCALP